VGQRRLSGLQEWQLVGRVDHFHADYAYKEQEGNEAAREMRLGWLRDFAALQSGQDAPLIAFTSRTHSASKIVGYNKAAMFFFMLRIIWAKRFFIAASRGCGVCSVLKSPPGKTYKKCLK